MPVVSRIMLRLLCVMGSLLLVNPMEITADEISHQGLLSSEQIKRGEFLFKGACGAYCHSVTPELRDAPYLFDCEAIHGLSDLEMFKVIFNGVSDTRMPAFGKNLPKGEEDIQSIIEFIKSKRPAC